MKTFEFIEEKKILMDNELSITDIASRSNKKLSPS